MTTMTLFPPTRTQVRGRPQAFIARSPLLYPKGLCWFFFFFWALQSINPTDYSALFCFTEPLQSDIPVNNKLLMNQTSTELVSPSCLVPRQNKSLSDLVWWEKLVTHGAPIDKQFRNEGQDKKLPKTTWLKMTGPTLERRSVITGIVSLKIKNN